MLARVAIRSSGRTSYEHVVGHRMRTAIACFGEKVWFRRRRVDAGQGKAAPEYIGGIYLGMAGYGVEHLIGTESGVETTRDIRRLCEGEQWDVAMVHSVGMSFEKYFDSSVEDPEVEPLREPQTCEGPA